MMLLWEFSDKLCSLVSWERNEGLRPNRTSTAKDEQVFLCPADNPHPSKENKERGQAWGFNPFGYSYGIGGPAVGGSDHTEKEHQVLTADANFGWMQNFSARYLLLNTLSLLHALSYPPGALVKHPHNRLIGDQIQQAQQDSKIYQLRQ